MVRRTGGNKMLLYHYTTVAGLEGIIRSKSIRASDYRFLNDATEFRYGLNIFERALSSSRLNFCAEIMELINRFLSAKESFSVFIAAFSEQPDLLSQWRGYNSARGYSIGLNGDWLTRNADAQKCRLFPVLYKVEEQQCVVADKLVLLQKLLDERPETKTVFETVREWWGQMLYTIVALKNHHFREEEEYRLVRTATGWPNGVQTRETPRGLVPYISVKLNATIIDHPMFHPNNVGLERIVVGPGLPDQQKLGVEALLASQHMRVTINKSESPYLTD
jgi:hypothetical protein